jgi:hypothetical protein
MLNGRSVIPWLSRTSPSHTERPIGDAEKNYGFVNLK